TEPPSTAVWRTLVPPLGLPGLAWAEAVAAYAAPINDVRAMTAMSFFAADIVATSLGGEISSLGQEPQGSHCEDCATSSPRTALCRTHLSTWCYAISPPPLSSPMPTPDSPISANLRSNYVPMRFHALHCATIADSCELAEFGEGRGGRTSS